MSVVLPRQSRAHAQGFESVKGPGFTHPEIKCKKAQCQYKVYQECGFLYLISQCSELWPRVQIRGGGS
eukprot:3291882-Rhodomonas_salina.1